MTYADRCEMQFETLRRAFSAKEAFQNEVAQLGHYFTSLHRVEWLAPPIGAVRYSVEDWLKAPSADSVEN